MQRTPKHIEIITALILVLIALAPTPCFADNSTSEAKQVFAKSVIELDKGNYQTALQQAEDIYSGKCGPTNGLLRTKCLTLIAIISGKTGSGNLTLFTSQVVRELQDNLSASDKEDEELRKYLVILAQEAYKQNMTSYAQDLLYWKFPKMVGIQGSPKNIVYLNYREPIRKYENECSIELTKLLKKQLDGMCTYIDLLVDSDGRVYLVGKRELQYSLALGILDKSTANEIIPIIKAHQFPPPPERVMDELKAMQINYLHIRLTVNCKDKTTK